MIQEQEILRIKKKKRGKEPISEGSSRRVYDIDGYILKKAKNKRGRIECSNEYWLYTHIEEAFKIHLCPVLYYEEGLIIMKKTKALDLDMFNDQVKEPYQFVMEFLLKQYEMDDFDLGCHFNWGMLDGKPVIIDYGHNYFNEELKEQVLYM